MAEPQQQQQQQEQQQSNFQDLSAFSSRSKIQRNCHFFAFSKITTWAQMMQAPTTLAWLVQLPAKALLLLVRYIYIHIQIYSISATVMYSERLEFITLHIYLCLALIRNFPYYYVRKKPLKALLYRDDIFIAKRPPLLADSWQLALYEKLLSTFFISRPSPRKSQ